MQNMSKICSHENGKLSNYYFCLHYYLAAMCINIYEYELITQLFFNYFGV